MAEVIDADLCIIGAGSAGLSVAAGASQMGAKTVLIEAGEMGGDCLNYGCVPSKAMLAAGHAAAAMRQASRFGVTPGDGQEPAIDFARVHDHIHDVIAGIAPHDSVARFEGLGVEVIRAHGRFLGRGRIEAGGRVIEARRAVVATGSRPMVPPIPGLDQVPFATNETIFRNRSAPAKLIVIGGGPIGCELAQAHRRLGAEVTVIDLGPILPKDDPELVETVRARLLADGIRLKERVEVEKIEPRGNGVAVIIRTAAGSERIEGSDLLVAAGRAPRVDGLGLEAAGIEHDRKGIKVDRRLRTSNRHVFAIGDVAGSYQFTHVASYHAGIVIQNALFRLPAKASYNALPWVTFTDPELAHVGRTEAEARAEGGTVEILTSTFAENDRARAERATEGLIKVVVGRGGRIQGASIVGAHAGELILPWVLAIDQGLKIKAMARIIAPYPTLSEISKRAAGSYYTPMLFSARTRRLVRFLARFG
jgi:pyruvate/2-oxoglutarate dehydrogenase complex dihydrolipoamide dehydrogenase (E3) component